MAPQSCANSPIPMMPFAMSTVPFCIARELLQTDGGLAKRGSLSPITWIRMFSAAEPPKFVPPQCRSAERTPPQADPETKGKHSPVTAVGAGDDCGSDPISAGFAALTADASSLSPTEPVSTSTWSMSAQALLLPGAQTRTVV